MSRNSGSSPPSSGSNTARILILIAEFIVLNNHLEVTEAHSNGSLGPKQGAKGSGLRVYQARSGDLLHKCFRSVFSDAVPIGSPCA